MAVRGCIVVSGYLSDPVMVLAARVAIALLFASSLLHKLRHLGEFRQNVADYRLLPARLAFTAALLLLCAEMATLFSLVVPGMTGQGALMAAGLLMLYALAMAINLARGRRSIDCGCAGPQLKQPISEWLLLRNALLIGLALIGAQTPDGRGLGAWDIGLTACFVLSLWLLYTAANGLLANAPHLKLLVPDHD